MLCYPMAIVLGTGNAYEIIEFHRYLSTEDTKAVLAEWNKRGDLVMTWVHTDQNTTENCVIYVDNLRILWDRFKKTPKRYGYIAGKWGIFQKGTSVAAITHWFEDTFCPVEMLL